MRLKATSDLWWKNAVLYCLDAETFLDSDGDGCGDLAGLTERPLTARFPWEATLRSNPPWKTIALSSAAGVRQRSHGAPSRSAARLTVAVVGDEREPCGGRRIDAATRRRQDHKCRSHQQLAQRRHQHQLTLGVRTTPQVGQPPPDP
jgi:hypothetical protein